MEQYGLIKTKKKKQENEETLLQQIHAQNPS